MVIFLSHISAEAQVASVLRQWIESSLDRDVLVSGEAENIQLGEQRLAEVDRALSEARVVLLLCSERSIGRPWINFESGCAWFKRVPVIAVCHSGCSKADLPPPLGSFQAFDLADVASCQALLVTLANHLQRKRIPRIDYELMVAEISAATGSRDVDVHVPEPAPEPAPAQPASAAPPKSMEVRLLTMIQRLPDFTCITTGLAEGLGERERKIRHCLDKLASNLLLTQRVSTTPSDPDTRYALTDKGRTYLAMHDR